MASSSVAQMESSDFQNKMALFPCMFNMPIDYHPMRQRLKDRENQLICSTEEGFDDREEEQTAKNTLTWIMYHVGHYDRAITVNESVLINSGYKSVAALGNFVFMEWLRMGHLSVHYTHLVELSTKPEFADEVLKAKAEQAYCLVKIGDVHSLLEATKLYEHILASKENDKWRYFLGLTYRRLVKMNDLETQSGNKLTNMICQDKAKECFEKAALSSDQTLKATSLVNMACLSTESKQAKIALVERALQCDNQSSEVCLIGGRALIYIDDTRAVNLLERAVKINPRRSVSRHQLGKAYIALLATMGPREEQRRNDIQHKAKSCFRAAYELSLKKNLTPLFDLARLLQREKNVVEANREVKELLLSRYTLSMPYFYIGSSHELYFQLSKSTQHSLLSLLTAIANFKNDSAESDLVAITDNLFRTNQRYVDSRRDLTRTAQTFIKKLNERRKYGREMDRIFGTISRFIQDGRIDDDVAVVGKTIEIARQGGNEEALLFLELVSLRPGVVTIQFKRLHLELLITEAKNCLRDDLGTSPLFFQQAFNLIFCNERSYLQHETDSDSNISVKQDVIVLFNDSTQNDNTLSRDTSLGLEDAISSLFNLHVAVNPVLKTSPYGGQATGLSHFVKEHKVNVILVVFEGDGEETGFLLEKLGPFTDDSHGEEQDRQPLVVGIQCDERIALRMPEGLRQIPCLSLGQPEDEFPNLFGQKTAQEEADESWNIEGVVQAYFKGDHENVVALFNHLTNRLGRDTPLN